MSVPITAEAIFYICPWLGDKVDSGIGPMVNVVESTYKVRLQSTTASGPIHHVFLWIRSQESWIICKICISNYTSCPPPPSHPQGDGFNGLLDILYYMFLVHTAKTKYRNSETNIPRKGISGSQSQFPHSCVSDLYVYFHNRSACSAGGNM
jgi:hypothetical protein